MTLCLKAQAIDDELGFDTDHEQKHIDLSAENSQTRVQQFIEEQCLQPQTDDPESTSHDTNNLYKTSEN